MDAIKAAEQLGIDLSLIQETLRLTPEQRAIQHQRALELALQLEVAWRSRQESDVRAESAAADPVRR